MSLGKLGRNKCVLVFVIAVTSSFADAQGNERCMGLGKDAPMRLGAERPLMNFSTLNDNAHPTWDSLRDKVVVIDFWATWCAPCLASFPKMNTLVDHFAGQKVEFFSVSYETPAMVEKVLRRTSLKTHVGLDQDFQTFRSFNAWAIPAVYIFDGHGRLAAEVNAADVNEKLIDAVLSGKRPDVPLQPGWCDPAGAEYYFRSLRNEGLHSEK